MWELHRYLLLCPFIIKSCAWIFKENNGHWNNEIQTFFYSNEFTFLKGEKYVCMSMKKY
jgi:hypothetical protein